MITNGEVIYEFKQLTDKHQISDDTGWSDSWIYFYLLRVRAYIIHQKSREIGRVSWFNSMTTPCMKLIDPPKMPCVPAKDCSVKMTEELIPQGVTGIITVTPPYGNVNYPEVESSKVIYKTNSRYPALNKRTFWFAEDLQGIGSRIFLHSEKDIEFIRAELIPENPIDIQRMVDCEGNRPNECVSNYDLEWKLGSDLTKIVLDAAIKLLGARMPGTDIKNNNMDDLVQNIAEIIGTNS